MYFRDHRLLYLFTKHYYVPETVLNPVVREASEGEGWQEASFIWRSLGKRWWRETISLQLANVWHCWVLSIKELVIINIVKCFSQHIQDIFKPTSRLLQSYLHFTCPKRFNTTWTAKLMYPAPSQPLIGIPVFLSPELSILFQMRISYKKKIPSSIIKSWNVRSKGN